MNTTFARPMRIFLVMFTALAAAPALAQAPQIEQARASLGRGDGDAAIATLEKAVAQYPQSARAHYYLATAYLSKIEASGMMAAATYAPKAKDEYEKTVALDPKYVEARLGLVQYYGGAPSFMGGSPEKALEQAKAIKAIDPVMGHRALAFLLSQAKQLDQARQEYLDGIREQPKSPKAHAYYGQYLVSVEKNYGAAFAEYEAALKVDPHYMPTFYHLGRAAALADTNLARGEESLESYLKYTPKEGEPTLARAHMYLGLVCEKQGNKPKAKLQFEAALKLNPTLKDASEGLKRVL